MFEHVKFVLTILPADDVAFYEYFAKLVNKLTRGYGFRYF